MNSCAMESLRRVRLVPNPRWASVPDHCHEIRVPFREGLRRMRQNSGMDIAPDLDVLGWCPFARLTGEPCILCGGTRAIGHLFRGDVVEAWRFNAVVVLLVVASAFAMFSLIITQRGLLLSAQGRRALATRIPRVSAPTYAAVFVAWWAWNLARW